MHTELFGLKSFLVRGVRKKHAKINPSILQPLSLLEVVFSNKENCQLHSPKEISSYYQFVSLPFNVFKSSQALFVNELVYRTVREEEPNPYFFNFLTQSIIALDKAKSNFQNIHIAFSIKLTRYLGFYPLGKYCPETPYFILKEGHFAKYKPDDELYLDQPMSQTFDFLLRIPIEESGSVSLSSDTRRKLLENIIAYFQLHLIGFGNIKSLDVLTQLFHS